MGLALALAFLSGVAIAVQAFSNGRLGGSLGSPILGSAVNNVIGLSLLLAIGVGTGAFPRGLRSARAAAGRPRWWHFLGGVAGATLIFVSTTAAPRVGVAVLTVALVCGQTTGSLVVDALGLSPAGRRPLTPFRLLGVALAVAAVTLAALGAGGDLEAGLLALAVLAGVGVAIQQAANGQLAARTGEAVAAGTINFAIGATILVVAALIVTGGTAPEGWSAPAWQWFGGALGVFAVLVGAWSVASLGVLRLILAVVAGQSAGALAVDLLAPVPGEAVGVGTVLGVALTVLAVVVSGRGAQARPLAGEQRATASS